MDNKVKTQILNFVADQRGSTAIEYALIASGLFLAIVVAVNALGVQVSTLFVTIKGMF